MMYDISDCLFYVSNYINILEKENADLRSELEAYKNNPPVGERENLKDYLIELMAPDIKRLEAHKNTIADRLGEIYRTYKKLLPDDDSGGGREDE